MNQTQLLINTIIIFLGVESIIFPGKVLALSSSSLTSQLIEPDHSVAQVQQGFSQGNLLFHAQNFHDALAVYKETLALNDDIVLPLTRGEILHNAAIAARILGQLDQAQAYVDEAIAIAQTLNKLGLLRRGLTEAGVIAYNRSEFDQALEHYQDALHLGQTVGNKQVEMNLLDNIGVIYRRRGQYEIALDYHQQALVLSETVSDVHIYPRILNHIGIIYNQYGDYAQSLQFNVRALAISQKNDDRFLESRILNSIGIVYINLSDSSQAEEFLLQSLAITQDIGNQADAGRTLNNLGALALNKGDYERATEYLTDALVIQRAMGNSIDEALSLGNLGLINLNQGDTAIALDYFSQSLNIHQTIGNISGEANALSNIASGHFSTGKYADALSAFERSRQLFQDIGAKSDEGLTLNSIGSVYYSLGQLDQALDYYQQSLELRREIGDRLGFGISLNNIGLVYNAQGQFSNALATFQEVLTLRREVGDRPGEASTLNSLGSLHNQRRDYSQAIQVSEQALEIYRAIGNPVGEATALTNLGISYRALSQNDQALESFQSALTTFQTAENREGERFILGSLGGLFADQGEIELAIVFYKQSVNLTEAIRQDLRPLAIEDQQAYTDTVAFTYRRLADLLLQSDRILEAQRVLDLLKVQELDDYLRGVERNAETLAGIGLQEQEQELLARFQASQTRLVTLGQELQTLEAIERSYRTPEQVERIRELRSLQQVARQTFRTFFESDDVQAIVAQLRQTTGASNLELAELNTLQDNLQRLEQNAVILYPLILDDRVELILVTATSPPIQRTVFIPRTTVNRMILNARRELVNHRGRSFPAAQALYKVLIQPLENDLRQAETDVILYAPDGQLRYIPLAALHDGEQWLAERFQVNNITATSLDNLRNQSFQDGFSVLAAAFVEGRHKVNVSDRTFSFSGLEFAGQEVEHVAALIPSTDIRIDADFSADIVYDMNDFNVVHLATHATFNPGPPENSFLLFGDGSYATLTDARDWNFPNVDLMVLSACETAVGDVLPGNGEEILGFGYLMQLAGADAAIASLWSVNDGGTQVLMDAFYLALLNGYNKAESLQRAQQALITGDTTILERKDLDIPFNNTPKEDSLIDRLQSRLSNTSRFHHPYYWSPFIIIGNGL